MAERYQRADERPISNAPDYLLATDPTGRVVRTPASRYATGSQGQLADSAVQDVAGEGFISVTANPSNPKGVIVTFTADESEFQGPPGPAGPTGPAATVAVGTVTTGAAGSSASVTNSGTSGAAVLDFTIPQGVQGEQGPQGIQGIQGEQGPKGDTGDTGPQGAQGIQGIQGVKGDTGDTGATGPQGDDGLSAYQVALANGFVGTESDWLASLVGPEGPEGPQGPAGTGTGDVIGPASSVAGNIAVFGDTSGNLIADYGSAPFSGAYADLSGKPTLFSGAFNDLTGKPTTLSGYGITDAAPLSHVGAGGTAHANAVASGAAGFMTGADKAKLDGIASGATANTGTVTSVGMTVPAGFSVSGSPVTSSGTLAVSYAAGYQGYTTTEASKLSGITAGADPTGSTINAATAKTTPVDADTMPLIDSAASNALKKVTWSNLKATLKTYFDTLYQTASAKLTALAGQTWAADQITYQTGTSTVSTTALTSFGRSLIDDANASTARTTLGLAIGTDVQAYSSLLASVAALALSGNEGKAIVVNAGATGFELATAGGGMSLPGGMTKDPRLLPVYDATGGNSLYVTSTNVSTSSANIDFWNQLALIGAVASDAVSNVYKTLCNITGSGILFHVISPAIANTSDDISFKITVDGTVYEIIKTNTWNGAGNATTRAVLGASAAGQSRESLWSTNAVMLNDFAGSAQSVQAFRKATPAVTLIPPSNILTFGWPCIRFEQSLKVETKVTNVAALTNAGYCGATYILD